MNLSRTEISFLKDAPSNIEVDMRSGWRYHYFNDLTLSELSYFIKLMKEDQNYLIIPLFSASKSLSNATLNLSEPFFINNQSNTALIIEFIMNQWNSSGFNINRTVRISFSIKIKKVWFYAK